MPIRIRNMTQEEYEVFYRWSVAQQAKELMEECRMSQKAAVQEAKEEIARMLPNGLDTEHNHLMTIEETLHHDTVGFIWTLHEETEGWKQSFLCDFAIWEENRRKGYATAALCLMEENALAAGCRESVLFVADRNEAARALYEKSGYQFLRQMDYGVYLIKQLT